MELVYLCTGQTATSVAVRKHTREATAKTVRFLFLEQYFQKYFARVLFVSDSFWAIIHRLFTSHWLVLRNINFMPLLFIFSVLSVSVDNDCSCSSGPEGKQRCKIGQLIFHLQVKVAWNSFPRHLYRISIKKKTLKKRLSLCEAKGNSLVFTKWLKSEVMAFQGNHNWCIYTWGNPVTWFFRSIS